MSLIPFRRKDHIAADLEQAVALIDLDAPEPDFLNDAASHVSAFLKLAEAEKVRLERDIRDRQERLRRCNASIALFTPVLAGLEAACDPPVSEPAAIDPPRKSSRKTAGEG